ncbi:MAG: family 43 glycosylhydrolase [Clostridia bacterium]|nr:family 43 glycosylhydrolase [Clostridia bacterium]
MKKTEIRIRDPFILTDSTTKTYYMYGTTDLEYDSYASYPKFSAYVSKDLENFEGPFVVFDGKKEGFWATCDYWAAEVWQYNGKYYLFGSFKAEGRRRATQILASDSPLGPFKPISKNPQTPAEWECLDGTLWVENGTPYMLFCHEWLQCIDGEMCAVELSKDLTKAVGEPFLLFKASDNPFVDTFCGAGSDCCRVTDGPFLFKENGKLKMIWSSHSEGKYSVLEATADNLRGAWSHRRGRFAFDGGHAMIFQGLDGKRYFSLHQPNLPSNERAVFIEYKED